MYHHYTLKSSVWHQNTLEFEWDIELGLVRGKDADRVRQLCEEAVKAGVMVGHPYPTGHGIKDPLKRISEMAVVLGQYWILSDDLSAAYPTRQLDELPVITAESGNEQYLQILH